MFQMPPDHRHCLAPSPNCRRPRLGAWCWRPAARSVAQQQGQRITPNFKDADITQLIEAVSQATGKNFIIDPRRARAGHAGCPGRAPRSRPSSSTRGSCRCCRCTASSPCRPATSSRSCPTPTCASIPANDLPNHVSAYLRRSGHAGHRGQQRQRRAAGAGAASADAAERAAVGRHRRQHADHFRPRQQRESHDAHHRAHRSDRQLGHRRRSRCRAPPRPTRCACSPR